MWQGYCSFDKNHNMKVILYTPLLLVLALNSAAQVKEGKVVFERKINMHKRMPPEAEQFKAMVPEFQTSKMELQFNGTQSLYKNLPSEENMLPQAGDGGGGGRGFMTRMAFGNSNDQTFRDYEKELITESRELGPKQYLIDDTLRPMKWKLEQDTATILGYLCYKASAMTSGFGMGGGMRFGGGGGGRTGEPGGNGGGRGGDSTRMRRFNLPAEQKVEAWFTQDIETSAGPDNYYGLPGLILKVVVDDGTVEYKALSLNTKDNVQVSVPKNGKKITRQEYMKMMQQQFQGMRPPGMGGGGGRMGTIIINQ